MNIKNMYFAFAFYKVIVKVVVKRFFFALLYDYERALYSSALDRLYAEITNVLSCDCCTRAGWEEFRDRVSRLPLPESEKKILYTKFRENHRQSHYICVLDVACEWHPIGIKFSISKHRKNNKQYIINNRVLHCFLYMLRSEKFDNYFDFSWYYYLKTYIHCKFTVLSYNEKEICKYLICDLEKWITNIELWQKKHIDKYD